MTEEKEMTTHGYYRCKAYMCQVVSEGEKCHRCGGEAEFVALAPCAYCGAAGEEHEGDCPCYPSQDV